MNTKKLIEAIHATGREPTTYSGRGMFGEYCVSVYLDQYDRGKDLPQVGAHWDSMGKGSVIYWPRHKAPEDMS